MKTIENIYRQDKEETVTILSIEYNRLLQQEVQLCKFKEKLETSQMTCSQKSNEIKKLKSLLLYYRKKEAIGKEEINDNDDCIDNAVNDGEADITNVN